MSRSGNPSLLNDDQRQFLLQLARASMICAVSGSDPDDPDQVDLPHASGVFVTIKRRGQLRGCLGTLQVRQSLAIEVARCAVDSAREDPRFPPVTLAELPDLSLEISILGPLEVIRASPDAFTIGVHGLVAERGLRRGLLLPQVATEWGWTPEQFLAHTCIKAGLPRDAWQHGVTFYRFAAEVFGD
jgi:AmmeMemoRadiSam system protein A